MKSNTSVHLFALFGLLVVMAAGLGAAGVGGPAERDRGGQTVSEYEAPVEVGRIETPDVTESSGLSASECQDVLWTHNDAGNEPLIFALDLKGKHLGTWRVEGARNTDWESIATHRDAAGKCSLLIADIGDNEQVRAQLDIYRIPEPQITAPTRSSSSAPLRTEPSESLRYIYPNGRRNAETILVHPRTGDIYVVTKEKSGPAGVHRIKPTFGNTEVQTALKVADISVPSTPEGLITGGSLSPDGTRLMLCDVKGGYEFVLTADAAAGPDEIWKQKPKPVNVGNRKQGEGVSYGRDGLTLYASSEKKNAPLFMIKRK